MNETERYEMVMERARWLCENSDYLFEKAIEMAEEELREVNDKIKSLENELIKLLIPKDENDNKNSILEIRAGTG